MIFSGHLFWLSECQLNDIWLFLRSLSLIFHKQGSFLLTNESNILNLFLLTDIFTNYTLL